MMWRECDDDGAEWIDGPVCWSEIEDFCGPEYLMWRDELDEETRTYRPSRQTLVLSPGWQDRLC